MTMKVRALLVAMVLLAEMSLVSCGHYACGTTFGSGTCSGGSGGISGGGGSGSNFSVLGYFVEFSINGSPSGMALQKLDTSAANQFVTDTSFVSPVLPALPTGIVIVNKTMMYLSSSDGTLFAYTIGTTGNLTAVGTPYTVAGGNSIAASASGNLLFVGDRLGGHISVFTVNADASLTPVAGSPFATSGLGPLIMTTDGKSKFLYVTGGTGSSVMEAFSIGGGGVLTPVSGSPFASNMATIAGEASGNFIFGVTRQASDNHIYVFRIDSSTGVLTQVGSPVLTQGSPFNISVHPTGSWVYGLNQDGEFGAIEPIEGFSLDKSTGALSPMAGSPFAGMLANGGPIDQSGHFMFGLGVRADGVGTSTPYTIDQTTGELTSTISPEGFPGIETAAYAVTNLQ